MFNKYYLTNSNQVIGVWSKKSIQAVSLIISVVANGNGYVPFNTEWPLERIKFALDKSKCKGLFIESEYLESLQTVLSDLNIQYQLEIFSSSLFFIALQVKAIKLSTPLAYVLFTSGSTGYPKGIVHGKSSFNAFLKWCSNEFIKYKVKSHISISPLSFDLSVYDIFHSFYTEATLFVPKEEIISNTRLFSKYIFDNRIESIYTTPSYLNVLLETGQLKKYNFDFVKLILIAGEPLNYELLYALKIYFKNATFYNLYGPTETNVCCAFKVKLSSKQKLSGPVPIGVSIYKNELSVSSSGELIYKGNLLMNAFINETGWHKASASKKYATGDIVINQAKNGYTFVKRKDNLVKRNGFRIELAEINRVLKQFKNVTSSYSVSVMNAELKIISFVECNELITELELKKYCLDNLPSYMLPNRIIILDKFPLNLNHKLDLIKLKELYAQ